MHACNSCLHVRKLNLFHVARHITKIPKLIKGQLYETRLNMVSWLDLPEIPHQPTSSKFPKRAYGKRNIVFHSFHANGSSL